MADPVAVATMRAKAEDRLRRAVAESSRTSGVQFMLPPVPAYEPALAAAHLILATAEYFERLNKKQAQEKPQ